MKCDVVFVGSGIAAMCGAAKLSKAGARTIMLESLPKIGGRFLHIEHKGCLITTGSFGIAWGTTGPLGKLLKELDAFQFEAKPADTLRYIIRGKPYDVQLTKAGGLQRLVSAASRSEEETIRVMNALKRTLRWLDPSDTISFRDWFLQYSDNETIYNIFQGQAASWAGIHLHELPAGEFIRVTRESAKAGGFLVPKNGVTDVIDGLESVIRANGGEIIKNAKVSEITVEDGVARGVVAAKNKEQIKVEAEYVVSNIGPLGTIELGKPQNFDIGYLKEVRNRVRPSVGIYAVFTSDRPLLDFQGLLYSGDTRRPSVWADWSLLWPDYAPPGKNCTYVFSVPDRALWYDRKAELDLIAKDAQDLFPHFDRSGVELVHWCNFNGNWPAARSWPGYMMGTKTSVVNLYSIGDGHCPPGYSFGEGAALSGIQVADEIKTALKRS